MDVRQYTEGGSDTKDVCGDYPAVYAVDVASFMDGRKVPLQTLDENPAKLRTIQEAYDRGMVVMACMHLNNPLTGGDSWDNSSHQVAAEILKKGSETQKLFDSWLDNLADLAKSLKGSDGVQIPMILRCARSMNMDTNGAGGAVPAPPVRNTSPCGAISWTG